MRYKSDTIVQYLIQKSKFYSIFRDHYQVDTLIGLWRNYISQEDKFNRYAEMTSHGLSHIESVATLVADLVLPNHFLTDSELFVLTAIAHLHDVGMYQTFDPYYSQPMMIRHLHGVLSRNRIERETQQILPTLHSDEVHLIALLASYHQGKAALSEDEKIKQPIRKRMRMPVLGTPDDIPRQELPEQPSLEFFLKEATKQGNHCFSLKEIQDPICPFLLGILLKFLDGCDFQASRTGSVETLLRHVDRTRSHLVRSELLLQDCEPDSPSYLRTKQEIDFFGGSDFHFIRNLLIERTFIISDAENNRAKIVTKPVDPDEIMDVCERILASIQPDSKDITVKSMLSSLEILSQYQKDPMTTMRNCFGEKVDEGFLEEWKVDVPKEKKGDKKSVHAMVVIKYVERELNAVAHALKGTEEGEFYYCRVCPNRSSCSLKKRRIPDFGNTGDGWNVEMFERDRHLDSLIKLPYLKGSPDLPRFSNIFKRPNAEKFVGSKIGKEKQLLLFGPSGRGKSYLVRSVAQDLVRGNFTNLFWFKVPREGDQIDRFFRVFAECLATNGEFGLENLIRDEHITFRHRDYLLDWIQQGPLRKHEGHFVLCVDDFNRLDTKSRPFFREIIERFSCINCPQPDQCKKQGEKKWGCELSRSYVMVISSKIPGQSWQKSVGEFSISRFESPILSDQTMTDYIRKHVKQEETQKAVKDIWQAYGNEVIGICFLRHRMNQKTDDDRMVSLFHEDWIKHYKDNFGRKGLEGANEVQIMKLAGLLHGSLTRNEIEMLFNLKNAKDEGALKKLIDRGLLHEESGKLESHPAWSQGNQLSGWLDSVGHHPWIELVAVFGLSKAPAQLVEGHWDSIQTYFPEIARLSDLPGGNHHHYDPKTHSLKTLEIVSDLCNDISKRLPGFGELITDHLSQKMGIKASPWTYCDRRTCLQITAFFHDIGKYGTKKQEGDKISYIQHDVVGAKKWEYLCKQYGVPESVKDHVARLIELHLHPLELFGNERVRDSAIRRLIVKTDDLLIENLLLFWADSLASGNGRFDEKRIIDFICRILTMAEEISSRSNQENREIFGQDLIESGWKPGREMGEALKEANRIWKTRPDLSKKQILEMIEEWKNRKN